VYRFQTRDDLLDNSPYLYSRYFEYLLGGRGVKKRATRTEFWQSGVTNCHSRRRLFHRAFHQLNRGFYILYRAGIPPGRCRFQVEQGGRGLLIQQVFEGIAVLGCLFQIN
jgi:hypothetical protein